MALVCWQPVRHSNPFEGISMLQRRMNHFFDENFKDNSEDRTLSWTPRVDLVELDDRFEVSAELPGLSHDQVKVEVQENVLTLTGEKTSSTETKDKNHYVCERNYGQFRRSFRFPIRLDSANIDATFKEGVLTVKLPKIEEAKSNQIEVKIH